MDFFETLTGIFPNIRSEKIRETIAYVESDEGDEDPEDFKLDRMINILLDDQDDLLDEAAGFNRSSSDLVQKLLEIFPDASPDYIENLVQNADNDFSTWVHILSEDGYEKVNISQIDLLHSRLVEMLPKVDPSYLKTEACALVGKSEVEFVEYVNNMIDKKDNPSIEEYYKREANKKYAIKYTEEFIIDDFLKEIPDPFDFFGKTGRKHSLQLDNTDGLNEQVSYASVVLHNHFNCIRSDDITRHLKHYKNDILKVSAQLERLPKAFLHPRPKKELPVCNFENKLLLQELAFVQNKTNLRRYIKFKNEAYKKAYDEAKAANLLETCECCYNDELLPEECYFCVKNCIFCKDCVRRGTETGIGDGNLTFPCFNDCKGEFTMGTLQMVLDPIIFHRLMQRKQIDDLNKANLNDIVTCTFCSDYVAQQNPNDKIFVCKNNACLKETCLDCGHESHVPLRCEEVEYSEDVMRRTYIENKMTEALVRTCGNCKKKMIKDSGCNKMTCTCGTTLCYICGTSNIDYNHFGILPKCALHNDMNEMHINRIREGAKRAKQDLGIDANPSLLKFDPSRDLNV